jgi:hypothetical protein
MASISNEMTHDTNRREFMRPPRELRDFSLTISSGGSRR